MSYGPPADRYGHAAHDVTADGGAAARRVAAAMAPETGWDEAAQGRAVDAFRAEAAAEGHAPR